MKKSTFTESLYVNGPKSTDVQTESPYQTWLCLTTEKVILQFWLHDHLPTFALSKKTNRQVHVLDLGRGFGHISQRLIQVLHAMGLNITVWGSSLESALLFKTKDFHKQRIESIEVLTPVRSQKPPSKVLGGFCGEPVLMMLKPVRNNFEHFFPSMEPETRKK